MFELARANRSPLHLPIVYLWALGWLSAQLQAEAQLSSSSITTSTSTSTSTLIRLRSNKPRRPVEFCRENLPRKSEDLPVLVITGRIKEVYFNVGQPGSNETSPPEENKALVSINRLIKGSQQLMGADIIVSGFNQTNSLPCPNYIKPNDTYIMLLNQDGDRKFSIQNGNLFSLNLNNLDRINAVANDEPYKRRPPIEDILCEAHYCPYGLCKVAPDNLSVSCQCPDSCPPLPQPVCGSDNVTYTNECHLVKEGCRQQRPLFVTKETSC